GDPLPPGSEFEWTVGATPGRISSYRGRFRTITIDEFKPINDLIHELAANHLNSTDGLFLIALAYRDAGLYYEASHALDRLAEFGSGKGRAFFMLRGDILDKLGDLEGAARAFAAADAEPATE